MCRTFSVGCVFSLAAYKTVVVFDLNILDVEEWRIRFVELGFEGMGGF
jgi:hypothetical protein